MSALIREDKQQEPDELAMDRGSMCFIQKKQIHPGSPHYKIENLKDTMRANHVFDLELQSDLQSAIVNLNSLNSDESAFRVTNKEDTEEL